jgi:hypothetical protein
MADGSGAGNETNYVYTSLSFLVPFPLPVVVLGMELNFFLCSFLFIAIERAHVWDYALFVSLAHFILSCIGKLVYVTQYSPAHEVLVLLGYRSINY